MTMIASKVLSRRILPLLLISLTVPLLWHGHVVAQQVTLEQLKAKLQEQYGTIYHLFANGPGKQVYPPDPRERIRQWQDDLARSFADAQATIDEIIKLHPPDEETWRERRDTMWLYSQPVSPPTSRTVFGVTEVDKRARMIDAPAAIYPDAARAANAQGEVRLRMVLAGDGTVKYIFPMRPQYGLTEAAMAAARHIRFSPAIRDGKPVSQFTTLSYEFKHARGLPPYVPEHEFYF
jgi:TonB family protein